jgi:SAM-dependent methyltransferase
MSDAASHDGARDRDASGGASGGGNGDGGSGGAAGNGARGTGGASPADPSHQVLYQKKDFWSEENLRYRQPHLRLEKSALIIGKIARGQQQTLLDIGCGPATLMGLLPPNIRYHGIDIAIQEPAPNLMEADLVRSPISYGGQSFDIVVAQGFFEYVGDTQSRKFAEIAELLAPGGTFLTSYVNFGHRDREIYQPYNNVQPAARFRRSLAEHFTVRKTFPTSYNWNHREPGRGLVKAVNMRLNLTVPLAAPRLAVQYFFVCTAR